MRHWNASTSWPGGSDARTVFSFPPLVAPTKATVFPLLQKAALNDVAGRISGALTAAGLSNLVDTTGNTIGKRYARTDEIGVPYAVTVDFQSLDDDTVTLRERDSMAQVRVPSAEVPGVIKGLIDGGASWEEVQAKYPAQEKAADGDEE